MGDAVDVTFDGFERCCNGCQIMKGGENTLHKTGEKETLIDVGTVFFVNQLNLEVKTTLGRTVEIRNFTRIRQKILR